MLYPTTLKGKYVQNMTDDEFTEFCQDNNELRIERLPNREILVQEPTFYYTGKSNNRILHQLTTWSLKFNIGECVDSNTGFFLKNGSMRSPDAAWISNERLKATDPSEFKKFPHLCPDFIVELKSSSDSLKHLKAKMIEWMENGCILGWLIDPETETVYVYQDQAQTEHQGFEKPISGEPLLPGFELILSELRI